MAKKVFYDAEAREKFSVAPKHSMMQLKSLSAQKVVT